MAFHLPKPSQLGPDPEPLTDERLERILAAERLAPVAAALEFAEPRPAPAPEVLAA